MFTVTPNERRATSMSVLAALLGLTLAGGFSRVEAADLERSETERPSVGVSLLRPPSSGAPSTLTSQHSDVSLHALTGESSPGDVVARYYDPGPGRFTSRDPIGVWGDTEQMGNGYGSFGNNGVNFGDPFGLGQTWAQWAAEKKAELKAAAAGFVETFTSGEHPLYQAFVGEQQRLEKAVEVAMDDGSSAPKAVANTTGVLLSDAAGTTNLHDAYTGTRLDVVTGNGSVLSGQERYNAAFDGTLQFAGAATLGAPMANAVTSGATGEMNLASFMAPRTLALADESAAVGAATRTVIYPEPPPVFGSQIGLRDPALVDTIKADMYNGEYRFDAPEGRVGGWNYEGKFTLGEGHHRMCAAKEIHAETGDPWAVNKLLEKGSWTDAPPPESRPLPGRSFWQSFRNWLGL